MLAMGVSGLGGGRYSAMFVHLFGKDGTAFRTTTVLRINTQLYCSYREKRRREEKEEQTAEPNTTTPSLH
jgi:hypothetical protein